MKNSIAVRLALMFAAAAMAGFALVGASLHRVLAHELVRHQEEQIDARLEDMAYILQHGRAAKLGERMREKLETLGSADSRTRFWMWSEDPAFRYGADMPQLAAAMQQSVELPVGTPPKPMRVRSSCATSSLKVSSCR